MCNNLHGNSKPIKEEGIGYKLFSRYKGEYAQCFTQNLIICEPGYIYNKDGFITWDTEEDGEGFCFFLSHRTAQRALNTLQAKGHHEYSNHIIRKIQYKKGLGKHIERNIKKPYKFMTALCKQFKIIED